MPITTDPNSEAGRPPSYTHTHTPGRDTVPGDETRSSSTNISNLNYSERPSPTTSHLSEFCQSTTGYTVAIKSIRHPV